MTHPSSLSGQRLGAYDVGPLLGAGGMGEVYRARDAKLNRDVALKVLLPAVAADTERLARFRREAQTLASLNHPGIAQIYGLEDSSSGPFLVMELVDGPTLADRIAAGALPVDEAIAMARQIVDALEAAHERAIIHRDLKPANIKVRDDGTVKILDFGLAKALDRAAGNREPETVANSPTITSPAMTQAGLILGTAAYMSPEQAKGRAVDKRTDVWAFGCVFYEMLTGRRAFDGEDVTDTIAAVVRGEPDWTALPTDTPSQIRLLLKRCLDKDRRTRIADISVARFVMNEPMESSVSAPDAGSRLRSRRRLARATAAGVLAGGVLVAGAWILTVRSSVSPTQVVRFTITPPAGQPLIQSGNRDVVMAPGGSYFLYASRSETQSQPQLMLRDLHELDARAVPGAMGARFAFTSPDGRWIGFQADDELRKLAVTGGAALPICRLPRAIAASWGDDGFIVAAQATSLYRVSADGGEPRALITTDPGSRELYSNPHVLPGSKWVLFTVRTGAALEESRIDALNLVSGERKTVIRVGRDAAYVDSGHLVYVVSSPNPTFETLLRGTLHAVRFDTNRAEVKGDSVAVMGPLAIARGGASDYSVSSRGDLIYVQPAAGASAPTRRLVWVDRKGKETLIPAEPRSYAVARISPDGTRIALDLRDQTNDIWIWDIARQNLTFLNRDPGQDMSPVWTPEGKRIIWTTSRGGGFPNLYWQSADSSGTAERLTTNPGVQFPTSITPDGGTVFLFSSAGGNADIFRVAINAQDKKAERLISGPGLEWGPEISPDGKWLAYQSDESGEFQIYVKPYPNVEGSRTQISTTGGSRAAWARNSRELFYLDRDDFLTAVAVHPPVDGRFSAGAPAKILNTTYYGGATIGGFDLRGYDVSPDGQRFLMIKDVNAVKPIIESPRTLAIVMNWVEELKARLPSR